MTTKETKLCNILNKMEAEIKKANLDYRVMERTVMLEEPEDLTARKRVFEHRLNDIKNGFQTAMNRLMSDLEDI